MTRRTDLDRLENTLTKVNNPPDVKVEPKLDFKSYMNSPLKSSKPKINLNLPDGSVGAVTGGVAGGIIGYNINKEDRTQAKEMCDALSQDCVGNKKEPPAAVKQNLNKQRMKTGINTLIGTGAGAGIGYAIDKATSGKGLKIGNFRLKIG